MQSFMTLYEKHRFSNEKSIFSLSVTMASKIGSVSKVKSFDTPFLISNNVKHVDILSFQIS